MKSGNIIALAYLTVYQMHLPSPHYVIISQFVKIFSKNTSLLPSTILGWNAPVIQKFIDYLYLE